MTTKLLLAATVALGLAAGAVPAFAQSATTSQPGATSQPGSAALADNGAASVQAQNFSTPQTMGLQPSDSAATPSAHVGQGTLGALPSSEQWDEPNG